MEHALYKKVPVEILQLFQEIELLLLRSSFYLKKGRLIDCHELSESLAMLYFDQLRSRFGVFAGVSPHSWLISLDEEWLIDPYPVACLGGPLLIKRKSHWQKIYIERRERPFLMRADNFPERVRYTYRVLCRTKALLPLSPPPP